MKKEGSLFQRKMSTPPKSRLNVSAYIRKGSPAGTATAEDKARTYAGIANIKLSKGDYHAAYENLNRAFYRVENDHYFGMEGNKDTRLKALQVVKTSFERLAKPKYASNLNPKEIRELRSRISILEDRIGEEKKSGNYRTYGSVAAASIIGLIGGIFFLSSNITGNAIADLTTKTTSLIGAGLLIVGLVAGFFWMRAKR